MSAATFQFLTAVAVQGAGVSIPCDGPPGFWVRVSSVAGSSATVELQGSISGAAWLTLATWTNPTAAGDIWSGEPLPFMRCNVTAYSTGTITAVGGVLNTAAGRWHQE